MEVIKGGKITAGFTDKRPLSVPAEKRNHIHGAIDIAGGDGLVRSPVDGIAQGFAIFRAPGGGWDHEKEKRLILDMPWREYFADIFGAIITIEERRTGRLHILAHFWPEVVIDGSSKATVQFQYDNYLETAKEDRFVSHILMTKRIEVEKGDILAPVGNAGFSTGAHVHWEIHHSTKRLDVFEKRVNPEDYL